MDSSWDRDFPTAVREAVVQTAFEVLVQPSLRDAAVALLRRLSQEDGISECAFLLIPFSEEKTSAFGLTAEGTLLTDPSFLLNHHALTRALTRHEAFWTDSFSGHGGASFGPEAFVGVCTERGLRLVVSVRRARGAPSFTEQAVARLQDLAQVGALALERFWVKEEKTEASVPEAVQEETYFGLVCVSSAMKELVQAIERVKDTPFPVCVFGESGTGKELVARAIHQAGSRSERPFVAESAGAITESLAESELFGHVKGAFTGAEEDKEGLFVLAHGGTLYLDEIADMSPAVQTKILRAIQEGKIRPVGGDRAVAVEVRLITSTNRDLETLVREGAFREDLYWRLNVIRLTVPPLRDRREDVPLLVAHFLKQFQSEGIEVKPLSESAERALRDYHWPGNVRQLGNVLRRVQLTAQGRRISRRDLERHLSVGQRTPWHGEGMVREGSTVSLTVPVRESFKALVGECEKAILRNALREFHGNKSEITRALKIPRQSLYNKLQRYGLLGRESEQSS